MYIYIMGKCCRNYNLNFWKYKIKCALLNKNINIWNQGKTNRNKDKRMRWKYKKNKIVIQTNEMPIKLKIHLCQQYDGMV